MRDLTIVLLALVSGCGDLIDTSPAEIDAPRLLAIRATPPVASIDGATALDALVVSETGQRITPTVTYRACNPWQFVTDPGRDCALDNSLVLDSNRPVLAVRALLERFPPPPDVIASLAGAAGDSPEPGEHCGLPPGIVVTVVAEAEVDGQRLLARKQVRVTPVAVVRGNPLLRGMTVDGQSGTEVFRPGEAHIVGIEPELDSLDRVCPAGEATSPGADLRPEPVRIHVYISAGEVDRAAVDVIYDEEALASPAEIEWIAPHADAASLWFVAIDGDGGVSWRQLELEAQGQD